MKNYSKIMGTIALSGLLVLAGCSGANKTDNTGETVNNTKVEEVAEANAPDAQSEPTAAPGEAMEKAVNPEGFPVDLNDAVAKFEEKFPGSQLSEVKLEHAYDRYSYHVIGQNDAGGHILKMDVENGALYVADEEKEGAEDLFDFAQVKDWKEAMKAVTEKLGATAVVEGFDLSMDDGKLVYDFTAHDDQGEKEVKVDALTGTVLEAQ